MAENVYTKSDFAVPGISRKVGCRSEGKLNKAFLHFLPIIWWLYQVWKIIKYGDKNLAKNEEKPCSSCLQTAGIPKRPGFRAYPTTKYIGPSTEQWKIIKYGDKNLAKNEEKPCSSCLQTAGTRNNLGFEGTPLQNIIYHYSKD